MQWLVNRLIQLLITCFGVVTLTFLLIHIVPGDPLTLIAGELATPETIAALRSALGLDLPLWQQYFTYWQNLITGDWGMSLSTREPVLQLILSRAPATAELAAVALIIACLLGTPAGLASAIWQGKGADKSIQFSTGLLLALPSFLLSPLLILVFALWLGLLPIGGQGSWQHVVLPALALGLAVAALFARQLRGSLIELKQTDFVKTAKAKGANANRVWLIHLTRNALLPVVTIFFLQTGALLTGAIITETIFSWPGFGLLLVQGLESRDYPLILGCVLFIALMYTLMTLTSDIVAMVLDPRLRRKVRRRRRGERTS